VVFRFVITKWNLRTPGRETDDTSASGASDESVGTTNK
jgi:PTS system N-acetylglucosamine-specific IIC component